MTNLQPNQFWLRAQVTCYSLSHGSISNQVLEIAAVSVEEAVGKVFTWAASGNLRVDALNIVRDDHVELP